MLVSVGGLEGEEGFSVTRCMLWPGRRTGPFRLGWYRGCLAACVCVRVHVCVCVCVCVRTCAGLSVYVRVPRYATYQWCACLRYSSLSVRVSLCAYGCVSVCRSSIAAGSRLSGRC